MQPEDMGADFDKLTPLEKAELRLKLAIERDATRTEIRIFTNRFRNEQNKAKRLALLKQLEANLSQEQIAKIKIKSKTPACRTLTVQSHVATRPPAKVQTLVTLPADPPKEVADSGTVSAYSTVL